MKLNTLMLSLFIALVIPTHMAMAATSPAIQQMAKVLLSLEHAATAPQRETLKQIASGTNVTQNEQNLAKAMLNIKGTVRAEDKQLVWGVLRDINAGEDEKELAKLINKFDNKANKSIKSRLQKLLPKKSMQNKEKENKAKSIPERE